MFGFVKKAYDVAKSPVGKMFIKSFIGGVLIGKGLFLVGEASETAGYIHTYNDIINSIIDKTNNGDGISYWELERFDKFGRPSIGGMHVGIVDKNGKYLRDKIDKMGDTKNETTEEVPAEPSV